MSTCPAIIFQCFSSRCALRGSSLPRFARHPLAARGQQRRNWSGRGRRPAMRASARGTPRRLSAPSGHRRNGLSLSVMARIRRHIRLREALSRCDALSRSGMQRRSGTPPAGPSFSSGARTAGGGKGGSRAEPWTASETSLREGCPEAASRSGRRRRIGHDYPTHDLADRGEAMPYFRNGPCNSQVGWKRLGQPVTKSHLACTSHRGSSRGGGDGRGCKARDRGRRRRT